MGAKRQPQDADKAGLAGHQVPHTRVPAGGAHPDEHLLLTDRRPAGVTQPEHVGRAAGVLNDRLQFATPPMVRGTGNTPPSTTPNTRAVPDATRFEQDRNAGRSPARRLAGRHRRRARIPCSLSVNRQAVRCPDVARP